MKSPSSLGLCVLMAASLIACSFEPVHASTPPDDTGQVVQGQTNEATALASYQVPLVLSGEHTLQVAKDSTFNPRTDFPKRPAVMTAGFGMPNLQECCGGGTWNYAEQPKDRTLPYLGIVLFASMLLAAVVHRAEKRRHVPRELATH